MPDEAAFAEGWAAVVLKLGSTIEVNDEVPDPKAFGRVALAAGVVVGTDELLSAPRGMFTDEVKEPTAAPSPVVVADATDSLSVPEAWALCAVFSRLDADVDCFGVVWGAVEAVAAPGPLPTAGTDPTTPFGSTDAVGLCVGLVGTLVFAGCADDVGDDSGAVPAPGPLPTAGTDPTTPFGSTDAVIFGVGLVGTLVFAGCADDGGDDSGAVPAPGPFPIAGTDPTTPSALDWTAFPGVFVVLVRKVGTVDFVVVSDVAANVELDVAFRNRRSHLPGLDSVSSLVAHSRSRGAYLRLC